MTSDGIYYSFEAIGPKTIAEQRFDCLRPGGTATVIVMIPAGQKIELTGSAMLNEEPCAGL